MTLEVAGVVVNTDEEGSLLDANDWDDCVAEAVDRSESLELTETHWGMVNYCRYRLFPQGPVPTLCKLAGQSKPVGEIED